MVIEADSLHELARKLSTPLASPADAASEEEWLLWMDLSEIDSQIAGVMRTYLAGGNVDPSTAQTLLGELVARPEMRRCDPIRFDLLVQVAQKLEA